MLLFSWSAGGRQLAAATVLSWLSLGLCSCLWLCTTICFNGTVWDLAVQSSDQSPAGVTVPASLCQQPGLGWREHRQPQGSHVQCRKCQPGRKLVAPSSAMEHLPQSLPKATPQELPRPSAGINLVPSQSPSVSSECWLLYPMAVSKVLQHENFQPQKTKLSMKIKKMEVTVWIIKAVQSQTGTWDSVNNETQAPQICPRLLYALQWELKRRGLWVPLCSRWPLFKHFTPQS